MSGGIDSATALIVLKEQGYEVTGVYLFMRGERVEDEVLEQLRSITEHTDIQIIIHDIREQFQHCVVNPFIDGYLRGETPSPCAECNPLIKWKSLVEVADAHGGGLVATGHYCRVKKYNDHYYPLKGSDPLKDQSYYMWQLSQEVLSRAYFPLGSITKSEVREFMRNYGWDVMVEKRESMGVCFLEGKSYDKWLIDNGVDIGVGEVVDIEGRVIGEHRGYPFYTLAQKRGFTLHKKERGFAVIAIDSEANRLVVGDSATLQSDTIYIKRWQFVSLEEALTDEHIEVKVRGVGVNPMGYCRLQQDGDLMKVTLCSDTAWAITKGQPVVFYINDRLIGGGIVERCQIMIL